MGCKDKNIADLIPDFVLGQLNEDETSLVKEHLSSCLHCQEVFNHIQWLSNGLKEYSLQELKQHVPSETLVKFADKLDALDQKTKEYVEVHLLFCNQCQSELQVLRDLSVELAPKTSQDLTTHTTLSGFLVQLINRLMNLAKKPAFAYAIAATILLITIIPRLTHDVFFTIQGIQTDAVSILSEPIRGTASYIPVYRQKSDLTVRLAIPSYWPDIEEYFYTISIEDETGQEYLQFEDFKDFGEKGFTQFILNTGEMHDNRYRLKIVALNKTDSNDIKISYYPFELITK